MSYRPYSVLIAEAQASNSTQTVLLKNNTGSSMLALAPVAIDSSGFMKNIDVTAEADSVKATGILKSNTVDQAYGEVVTSGKIENITTSLNFGDYVYVAKDGTLTNVLPSSGVNSFVTGDYAIRIGVIAKNQTNPANKDLLVSIVLVGQL
jgi:hypothetical protein